MDVDRLSSQNIKGTVVLAGSYVLGKNPDGEPGDKARSERRSLALIPAAAPKLIDESVETEES